MGQRNQSLDALRGFAILAMVLSGSIAFGILPDWMYHAQEPPPSHRFIDTLPGITWVDLVFPFFLFSMGAAIPLALHKKQQQGAGFGAIFLIAARRYLLLVFFALFTLHMRSVLKGGMPFMLSYTLPIMAFVLLFFQFYQPVSKKLKLLFNLLKAISFFIAALLLFLLPFKDGGAFSWYHSDIIILLLGNMAFFGSLIWWITKERPLFRLALLPLVMAVFLGQHAAGSWNETVFHWSPVPWMYKFEYLKYLFIIIPGTFAGEWMLQSEGQQPAGEKNNSGWIKGAGLLSLLIILVNVILLHSRHLLLNLLLTCLLLTANWYVIGKASIDADSWLRRFFMAACYLLMLGLFFEAYEGGIKKDPSTFSYYFVTSGLAFLLLITLSGLQLTGAGKSIINYLSLNGRNPMIAYVAGNLLVLPLLHITGAITIFNNMEQSVAGGFLRGLLFTFIVSLITVFFTRRGWLWKT